MRFFLKRYKYPLFMLLFILVGVLGYTMAKSSPSASGNAKTVSSEEDRIGIESRLTTIHTYNLCGHKQEVTEQMPRDYIDLSKDEFRAAYGSVSIKSFTKESVTIEHRYDCYCSEHVVVYLEEDVSILVGYQTEPYAGEQREVLTALISETKLLKEQKEALQYGKVFASLKEAEAYIAPLLAD